MGLSAEDARAVFDRRREAWLAEDVAAYLDCWVDDLVLETPGRVVRGRADYETMVRGSLRWARPRAFKVHHLAADGDVVLADWTITVERRADGQAVTWRGMSACELRDGRIVWWREYYQDPAALARAARG
ncbi:MAG TPA: nuclear transport factor 2 family protein [Acidimicrobiia bacterium]|jgi:limonene-1,2-epoxide hydrolase|nr:nuclear transport factor 2 family protein [Acidimicrobiia bacterium]